MTYSLDDMCKAGRTTIRGIRWWEKQGLLTDVPRTAGGHRAYSLQHVRQARIIAACQACGYPLAQIGRVLAEYDREKLIGDMRADIREIEALITNLPEVDQVEFDL